MLPKFIAISLFLWVFDLTAQSSLHHAPDKTEVSLEVTEQANRITQNSSSDEERVRSIFDWIARNISYQELRTPMRDFESTALQTLRNRRGVCFGFAHLFRDMCVAVGIESFVISGYASTDRRSRMPSQPNHAWNSAMIEGEWFLFDVTWAGSSNDGEYFKMRNPDTHIPAFYGWQLQDCTIQRPQICGLRDSLRAYLAAGSLDRAIIEARADALTNPGEPTSRYLGNVLVDKAIWLKEEGDAADGTDSEELYDKALEYFEQGTEHTGDLSNWQKEAHAMTILNLQRVRFNGLSGGSYSPDNLLDIIDQMEIAKSMLEDIPDSFTAMVAISRTNEHIEFIEQELKRIR